MGDIVKTVLLTLVALLAFAANSLLCRLALGQELIDAASFTAVRVISGAMILVLIVLPRWRTSRRAKVDWRSVATLFIYMAFFSFAYLSLSAGSGALILFGAVQLTMFAVALRAGEQFPLWVVDRIDVGRPRTDLPDLARGDRTQSRGALLMTIAGVAWGGYSLLGRGVADPLEATANNFIYSVPAVIIVSLVFMSDFHSTPSGLALAAASGAIASGLGYVIWYAALRRLTATRAATVQLSVPVIAAFGGVILLSEPITPRLLLASIATLGGVAIVLTQRMRRTSAPTGSA